MILLDTNALLWLHTDSPRLGQQSRRALSAAPSVRFSAASVLEIVVKTMLGKLDMPASGDPADAFRRAGLIELPFTAAHALALAQLPLLARHDPFDRMLLALGEDWIVDATS